MKGLFSRAARTGAVTSFRQNQSPRQCGLSTLMAVIALIAILLCNIPTPAVRAQSVPPIPVGANLMGVNDYDAQILFVDAMKQARGFGTLADPNNTAGISHDANGWPLSDCAMVLFDSQPSLDYSGTYHLSFNGKATVSTGYSGEAVPVGANNGYNAATNVSTWDITLPRTHTLVVLSFTGTQSASTSATNTGFKNLRIIRPGYLLNTTQTFTTAFKNAITPLTTLRFMQTTSTLEYNRANPSNGYDPTANLTFTNWSDHWLPGDATQQYGSNIHVQGKGMCWEYVIQLCNETGKDCWINIPISATDDYIAKLAQLFKYGSDGVNPYSSPQANPVYPPLNASLHLYLEYGNEVWNGEFTNYSYNFQVTDNEITTGQETDTGAGSVASNLNYDNLTVQRNAPPDTYYTNINTWNDRRVARRLYQITNLFKSVWGASAINTSVRPVLAWQAAQPYENRDQLEFLNAVYGAPKNYLYAVASAPYISEGFVPNSALDFSSTTAILNKLTECSNYNRTHLTLPWQSAALFYGIKHLAYEGGTDMRGPRNATEQANADAVASAPGMTALIKTDIQQNWLATGSDSFLYYSLVDDYWGLTPDATNLTTPKYTAITQIVAAPLPAVTGGLALPTTAGQATTFNAEPAITDPDAASGPAYLNEFGRELLYIVRVSGTASVTYSLQVNTTGAPTVQVAIDGQLLQTIGATAPPAVSVTLAPGQHGLRLRLPPPTTGEVVVNSIKFTATTSGGGGTGSLTGTSAAASGTANLTTGGTLDWAHWGRTSPTSIDRKTTGGSKISSYTKVGSGTVYNYGDDALGFSWTDGTPTASVTNDHSGVYITGINRGFSFTVPADATSRTLKVYVGGWRTQGTLTAHLSDGSAADYTTTASNTGNTFDRAITLTFNAASAGQTLTVTWKETADYNAPYGNVTLLSAALK